MKVHSLNILSIKGPTVSDARMLYAMGCQNPCHEYLLYIFSWKPLYLVTEINI